MEWGGGGLGKTGITRTLRMGRAIGSEKIWRLKEENVHGVTVIRH
jgi:hypothetical protein